MSRALYSLIDVLRLCSNKWKNWEINIQATKLIRENYTKLRFMWTDQEIIQLIIVSYSNIIFKLKRIYSDLFQVIRLLSRAIFQVTNRVMRVLLLEITCIIFWFWSFIGYLISFFGRASVTEHTWLKFVMQTRPVT